jgi:hypothetical protein
MDQNSGHSPSLSPMQFETRITRTSQKELQGRVILVFRTLVERNRTTRAHAAAVQREFVGKGIFHHPLP